jgi:hypothetical protein
MVKWQVLLLTLLQSILAVLSHYLAVTRLQIYRRLALIDPFLAPFLGFSNLWIILLFHGDSKLWDDICCTAQNIAE